MAGRDPGPINDSWPSAAQPESRAMRCALILQLSLIRRFLRKTSRRRRRLGGKAHLSATALARTVLMRRGAVTTGEGVLVTFPNGETRRMAAGPSSVISKAVIEEFAKRFLVNPAVLWVSESGAKVVSREDELAAKLKLKIAADRNLPDLILVDLGDGKSSHMLLVFIEVVASDGPVTSQRQEAL